MVICDECKCSNNGGTCQTNACKNNHVGCLEVSCDACGCVLDWSAPETASKYNSLDALKWCYTNNKKINLNTVLEAVNAGSQECLEYIYDEGTINWTKSIDPQKTAVEANNATILSYILDKGGILDEELTNSAAQLGYSTILTTLLSKSCPVTPTTLNFACKSGSLACVKLVVEAGIEINDAYVQKAITVNSKDIVEYLVSQGASLPKSLHSINANTSLEMIQYLNTNGVKFGFDCYNVCVLEDKYDIMVYLHGQGVEWDSLFLKQNLENREQSSERCYEYYYTNMI